MKYIFKTLSLILPFFLFGQKDSTKYKLIETLTKNISISYLNLELAKAMCDTVKNKLYSNRYDTLLNLDEFTFEVNKDLRRVSKDNHITIVPAHYFHNENYEEIDFSEHSRNYWRRYFKKVDKKWKLFVTKYKRRTKNDMFTYGEIKILPGNIGYVEIKDFQRTSFNKKENRNRISFESVLKYFKKTKSIIIDFRENLGGYVSLSAKFCSYFSEIPNTYFMTTEDVYRYDSSGTLKEYKFQNKIYTDNDINNSLIGDKDIFILTSKRTFSAAELTTYKLKEFNSNVKVVGEKTTGGGNGHFGWNYEKYYMSVIPCVKIYNESKSNYTLENNGIKPDILVTADSAFDIAYKLAQNNNDFDNNVKTRYFKKSKTITSENEEVFRNKYADYVGDYRKIKITLEREKLFMEYDFYNKEILIPDANDYFVNEVFEFVRFVRDKTNNVVEVQIKHKDGYLEKFRKQ